MKRVTGKIGCNVSEHNHYFCYEMDETEVPGSNLFLHRKDKKIRGNGCQQLVKESKTRNANQYGEDKTRCLKRDKRIDALFIIT